MLIIAHLSFMLVASLFFAAGIGVAVFGRKKATWLRRHKTFNLAGGCFLAAGAALAFANVVTEGGRHLAWFHQWMGLSALVLTGLAVLLGFYSFTAGNKASVRTGHRWSGRLSGLSVLSALALGLMMIGIL